MPPDAENASGPADSDQVLHRVDCPFAGHGPLDKPRTMFYVVSQLDDVTQARGGPVAVVPVTGVRMPLETREKVDRVAEEHGLGSRSEAMLFLIGLALMALPYLLNPDTVKKATRKAERKASISQRKGRARR